jgi:hypothetical protein
VARIDYDGTSREEFITLFEKPALPVVIEGCTASWNLDMLCNIAVTISFTLWESLLSST